MANTRIYILDRHLQPVPVGVSGELYIGGVGLARGYLNRPELTAEKFIPDPFSDEPEARLYKTGDLARYLPDGTIEFLGRLDYQVKLHGFRIELGEIEAALGAHPAVREAVVVAREEDAGDQRLVAYVVPDGKESMLSGNPNGKLVGSAGELRAFLQERMPAYMVPSAFVITEALPLTPNGKVDRKALPAPSRARPEPGEDFVVPPGTQMELLLAELWQEVLGVDRVSVHDNFFDLGGHSLLAVRVMSGITERAQVQVDLQELMFQTLKQLAVVCEKRRMPQQEAASAQKSLRITQKLFKPIKQALSRITGEGAGRRV